MSDILSNVETELRKRALAQFEGRLDRALESLRLVVEAHAGTMFHKIPADIEAEIEKMRAYLIAQLGPKVQDEAVRKGADVMMRLLGDE